MEYFSQLKQEQEKQLNYLLNDSIYLRDIIQSNTHHYDSLNVLCRLIQINLTRISDITEKTYENWQKLTQLHQTIRAIENSLTFTSFRLMQYREHPNGYRLIDELCKEILAKSGLNTDHFYHYVVCGGSNYQHTHPMNIIHCRLTDQYRPFHLALMAHEFGHHFTYSFFEPVPIINYNPFDEDNLPDPEQVFDNWKVEVASDIFGTLIMGPSLMNSHAFMPDYWLFQSDIESEFLYKFRIHPPCEIRFNLHREILGDLDIPTNAAIPDLFDMNNQVELTADSIHGEDYRDRVEDISVFIEEFHDDFMDLYAIIKRNLQTYTIDDWNKSTDFAEKILENNYTDLENYSVIQIINGINLVRHRFDTITEETQHITPLINSFNCL